MSFGSSVIRIVRNYVIVDVIIPIQYILVVHHNVMPVLTKSQALKQANKPIKKMQKLSKGKLAFLKQQAKKKGKVKKEVKHVELADPILVKKEAKEIVGSVCNYTKGKLRNAMLRKSRAKRIASCGPGKGKIAVCPYTYKSKTGKTVRVKGHCRKLKR
jgi:hypothetical protein